MQKNQLQLLSYVENKPADSIDTSFAKELPSFVSEPDRLVDSILEDAIHSEIMFIYRTLYFDYNFQFSLFCDFGTSWVSSTLAAKYSLF